MWTTQLTVLYRESYSLVSV